MQRYCYVISVTILLPLLAVKLLMVCVCVAVHAYVDCATASSTPGSGVFVISSAMTLTNTIFSIYLTFDAQS